MVWDTLKFLEYLLKLSIYSYVSFILPGMVVYHADTWTSVNLDQAILALSFMCSFFSPLQLWNGGYEEVCSPSIGSVTLICSSLAEESLYTISRTGLGN